MSNGGIHPVRRAAARVCVGLALVCSAAAVAQEGRIWEARTMAAEASRALLAAGQAAAAGNADAYGTHQERAEKLLRDARRLFEEAGIARLDDAEALVDYAQVLTGMGDVDLAAASLRRAVALTPDDAGLWLRLGATLMTPAYRRPVEAERALRRAVALEPEGASSADAHALLGHHYWEEGLYDFAAEHFARAHERAPDQALARAGLAAARARGGDVLGAVALVDIAQGVSPEVLGHAGPLLDKALADFDVSGRWFEDTSAAHLAYAKLLLLAGRNRESVSPLERAAALEPDNPVLWSMLGSVCAQLGLGERARAAFTRSLEIQPDQPRTREALQRLESAPAPGSNGSPSAQK